MSVETRLSEMQSRRLVIEQGGGQEKINARKAEGKMTARERIKGLCDPNSFIEMDAFVEHRGVEFGMYGLSTPGEGVVTGYATIDGRPVYLYSQDFTVLDGAMGEMQAAKICKVLDMAKKTGNPVIAFYDSAGARLTEGVDALAGYGEIFFRSSRLSGIVPQIGVVAGPCLGGAAFAPALNDFTVMINGKSNMYLSGAQLIESMGEVVGENDYQSAEARANDGTVNMLAAGEEDALGIVRMILSYLPQNNLEDAFRSDTQDDLNRITAELNELEGEYDIKDVLAVICDDNQFTEISARYAPNVVTGFARLGGAACGIVANQPNWNGGYLDKAAADKAAGFIMICDNYNLPIITLVDVPGFMPSMKEEMNGGIKAGARLISAYAEATVPKITLITGKAYGSAGIAMGSSQLGADMVYAWPNAQISGMNPDGAANILFGSEIASSADPIAAREAKIAEYRDSLSSPYAAAKKGYLDNIIEPATTRPILISALQMIVSKADERTPKKHGNMPL